LTTIKAANGMREPSIAVAAWLPLAVASMLRELQGGGLSVALAQLTGLKKKGRASGPVGGGSVQAGAMMAAATINRSIWDDSLRALTTLSSDYSFDDKVRRLIHRACANDQNEALRTF
jgi:hypothetical protein